MKISEVTVDTLMKYAREYSTDTEIIDIFKTILVAAKAYIISYTGLTTDTIDTKEDLTIVLLVLSNEMYENRCFTVQEDKVNKVVKSILDLYSTNLL